MKPDRNTELEWVKGVHAGDELAFKKMFMAFYPSLCLVAADIVGSYDIGKEVAHEVFLNIWERGTDWQPEGSLKVYLYHAVCKKSINYLKQDRRRRNAMDRYTMDLDIRNQWVDHSADENELIRKIWDTSRKMPRKRYLIFILHKRHGLSYKDIAKSMEISVKTVENQMGHALKFLREKLGANKFSG